MFVVRCLPRGRPPLGPLPLGPMGMMGAMAAPVLGGMALFASIGPFLLGTGVGAALVAGSLAARKRMQRRDEWKDDTLGSGGMTTAGMGGPDPIPTATDTLPPGTATI